MKEWIKINEDVWQKQTEVNWEQRRYEIAKDALVAILSNPDRIMYTHSRTLKNQAKDVVEYADALIKELKKK